MSLLRYAAIGAAVAYGINYITKKRDTDGKSILDDLNEKAPEWMDKAKKFGDETLSKVTQQAQQTQENYQ
ncbi:YtxH domain-containing protein [Mucilaginibacter sp. Bleaf8]|uniref:YtxH domain-containing protein n=1 Tax=Mucilaginibacter sp. Bleaf8 TaxID=2834430 RepID=UPI001BCAB9AB|nr:YtxH domain-containing protein [Mucilaginibacter sp. Bleaf8]MBS7566899.1 YtxH domain-containing protein [Mucilaginibacter sp. Bleaf8]